MTRSATASGQLATQWQCLMRQATQAVAVVNTGSAVSSFIVFKALKEDINLPYALYRYDFQPNSEKLIRHER